MGRGQRAKSVLVAVQSVYVLLQCPYGVAELHTVLGVQASALMWVGTLVTGLDKDRGC